MSKNYPTEKNPMSSSDKPLNKKMPELKLPVGIDDFSELVDRKKKHLFVD